VEIVQRSGCILADELKPLLPVHSHDIIVMRGCVMAVLMIMLLAFSGNLYAGPTENEKLAAQKQCRQELGPLGVPLWTAEGLVVCHRITVALK
jgi:hypothetical protein